MKGKEAAALLVFGGAAFLGFAFGFAWGQGTRQATPAATDTSFSGGVLTVKVDTYKALGGGLSSILGG